jgi:hypothetical protein
VLLQVRRRALAEAEERAKRLERLQKLQIKYLLKLLCQVLKRMTLQLHL